MRAWTAVGAFNVALAIALGAFGTHALRGSFDERQLAWWGTAQQYHVWAAIGLLVVTVLSHAFETDPKGPARLMATGMLLFSGSLYAMALTKLTWLGAVTPFGGACLILGWIVVGIKCFQR